RLRANHLHPWWPLTGSLDLPREFDRREPFVDWLTNPINPFFAKMQVNRLWQQLIGRGIVEPVDDFRESTPPANPELLAALANDFIAHRFDSKHILRTILTSRTYQLSSRANSSNLADVKYAAHAAARLLPAEQLLDTICQITTVPE